LLLGLVQVEDDFGHLIDWLSDGVVLSLESFKHLVILGIISKHVIVRISHSIHCIIELLVIAFKEIKGFVDIFMMIGH
jgi:hypothetical protein